MWPLSEPARRACSAPTMRASVTVGEAVGDQAADRAQQAHALLPVAATERVEHDVHALPVGEPAYLRGIVEAAVVERMGAALKGATSRIGFWGGARMRCSALLVWLWRGRRGLRKAGPPLTRVRLPQSAVC